MSTDSMILPSQNVIIYNISASISPSFSNAASLTGWNPRTIPISSSSATDTSTAFHTKGLSSYREDDLLSKVAGPSEVEPIELGNEEGSQLDCTCSETSNLIAPPTSSEPVHIPDEIIRRFVYAADDRPGHELDSGWTAEEIQAKVMDEILRIQQRAKISEIESASMIQTALDLKSAEAARQFIDEQPYRDLEHHDESSFITGDKNLLTFRPSDYETMPIKRKQKKKAPKPPTASAPVVSSKAGQQISKPPTNNKTKRKLKPIQRDQRIEDLKFVKALDEMERIRGRMIAKASSALKLNAANKAAISQHIHLAELERGLRDGLTATNHIDSARSDRTSNYSDLFQQRRNSRLVDEVIHTERSNNDERQMDLLDTFSGFPNDSQYIYPQDKDTAGESAESFDEDDCASLASASVLSTLSESKSISHLHHQVRDLLQLPLADWRRFGRSSQHLQIQEMKDQTETSLQSCLEETRVEDPVILEIWERMQRVDAELSILSAEEELEELNSLAQSSVVSLPQINFASPPTRAPSTALSRQSSFAESFTLPPCDRRMSSIQQLPVYRREGSESSVQNNGRALAAAANAGEAVGNFISNLLAKSKIK
jgi:hypothetical protein